MSVTKDGLHELQIRPAELGDLPAIVTLLPESTSGVTDAVLDRDALVERLSDPARHTGLQSCWVAAMSDQVVGHAISYDDEAAEKESVPATSASHALRSAFSSLRVPNSWYLSSLAVVPIWRRRGLGRRLLAQVAVRARAAGIHSVSLHVFEEKQAALSLYASLGLREVGRLELPPHPMVTARSDLVLMSAPAESILALAESHASPSTGRRSAGS